MESFNYNERGKCRKFSLSHRLQQLEENFKASGGKFINCKLENLFQIKGNPQLNKESFTFSETGIYPYFTRTVFNNGILGYVDYLDDEHKISGNTIAVGMLGMQFFYMEKDFYAGQFTKTLYPKVSKFNESIALYFIGMLNKLQSLFQGVLVRDFEKTFYNTEVVIPQKNNQIDFAYMEERIRVLEEERIRVLEAYLKVTGLDKYILTKEEQDAYDTIHNGGGRFKLYTIGSLFDVATGRDFIIGNAKPGNIPLVSHTNTNNGVVNYINRVENRRIFKAQTTIALADRGVFYATTQLKDFHIGTRVKALTFKDGEKSEEKRLFVTTAINKLQLFFTEYLTNATDKLPQLSIYLPVNQQDEIDYEFMETYIRAIEKKVIKNVIDWKDKEIERTKDVVSSVS